MICIQLKIKCKTILLKMLENGLNKSYFMAYQYCPSDLQEQREQEIWWPFVNMGHKLKMETDRKL